MNEGNFRLARTLKSALFVTIRLENPVPACSFCGRDGWRRERREAFWAWLTCYPVEKDRGDYCLVSARLMMRFESRDQSRSRSLTRRQAGSSGSELEHSILPNVFLARSDKARRRQASVDSSDRQLALP